MLAASSREHIASAGRLGNWSRTRAVPADCLCLRKAIGLWPMAGPALGPQISWAATDMDEQAIAHKVRDAMFADDAASRMLGMEIAGIGPGRAVVTMTV